MKEISLNGEWTLYYFTEGEVVVDSPADLARVKVESIPAQVPGNVELDLVKAGKLPDPFINDNIYLLRPFEFCQWWYTTEFASPKRDVGDDVRLVMHGLDTLATVWLNGTLIGETANMLIAHSFDVTHLLKPEGEANTLAVRIKSTVIAARDKIYEPSQLAMATNFEQLHIRKAPHMFGWDITPRAVSAGIWRPVCLEIHKPTRLLDLVYVTNRISGDEATLEVHWQFRTDAIQHDGFTLRFTGRCGDSTFTHTARAHFIAGWCNIHIPKARLWWPKGYGAPDLYEVTCELLRDEQPVDLRVDHVGIRTIELKRTDITTATEPGEFLFRVNDTPIMCKGSNWVPLDAFHSRDAERYEPVLSLFEDLGCNILRCWGGNVYEDTAFYDLCDQKGIMVWQDFAFACAFYPQDEDLLRQVRVEAEAVVHKLRNHPSIILWAGDNEIDLFYLFRGGDPARNRITREVLPHVCAALDPSRPYLPSSPYVSPELLKTGKQEKMMPEQHLWGPRDYFKGNFYANNTAHFASEIGYHGCPNISSIRRFIPEDRMWPWQDNEMWRVHSTDPLPWGGPFKYRVQLMADQIKEMFGFEPDTLDDFALASQISQAEAKKYFIEMFRLAKWRKTGLIWWNVIDCWPQFSDAIVDYYFTKKLAYWYIKRAQQPVCVMMGEPDGWHCRVAVGNDTLQEYKGDYRVTDASSGNEVLAGSFKAAPNATQNIGNIRVSHGEHRLFLMNWEMDGKQYGNHYLLGKPPFSFARYKEFLKHIADLPEAFDARCVAR